MKVFAVLVRSILSYISNEKPKLKCIKHVYVYTFLDLACDLIIYDNPSQVKSFSDLLRIRSSQVIFSSKISQVKSSQVTCDLTWLAHVCTETDPDMNIISTLKGSNKNNFDQQKLEEESVLLSGSYDDNDIAFIKQSHDHILIDEFL